MTTIRTDPDPDAGRTRAVVALAGTFCSPLVFEQLRPLLGDRFAVRALSWMTDAPSCTIDDAAAWVADSAPRGPLLLVGHSTGGAIALRLALARPDLVGGLMLINTGPNMHHHGDVTSLITTMEREGTADVARAVIERSFHIAPPPDDLRRFLDYADRVPLRAALEALRSQRTTDLAPDLPSVRVPVAIVHGRHDPVRTAAGAESMTAAFPDGQLHLVDAGHSPMYEAPAAVAEALRALDGRIGT